MKHSPGLIVTAVYYMYGAGATLEGNAYQQMKKEIVAGLKAAMPFDAVALVLHGAAVAEGVDDVEGDLCAAIRQELGPKVKLVMGGRSPRQPDRRQSSAGGPDHHRQALSAHRFL